MKLQFPKRSTVKMVAQAVTGFSAAHVTSSIVKNQLEPTNTREKVEIAVGSFAIGGAVAVRAEKYIADLVDTVYDAFEGPQNKKS